MSQKEPETLSILDAAIIVVGIVFGSGIFVAPKIVAGFCGDPWLSMLAWPLGALIAVCGSLCYAEAISRARATGGFYSVFRATYGEAFAGACGLVSQLVISPAAIAGPVVIGGGALAQILPGQREHVGRCAALSLLVLALLNICGVRFSKVAQRLFVGLKVGLVAGLLVACVVARVVWGAAAPSDAISSGPPLTLQPALLMPFFGVLLWTFDGWTEVTLISSRLKRPATELVRVLVLGLSFLTLIFMAVQAALMALLGVAGTAQSEQPFADAISLVFGAHSALIVDVAIAISAATSAHAVMWMVSSLTALMSRHGDLPRMIARVDQRAGRPVASVGFVFALALLALSFNDFDAIVALFSFFIWMFYGLMALSLFWMRRQEPTPAGIWVAPFGPLPIVIVCAVALAMTTGQVLSNPPVCAASMVGFALLFATLRLLRRTTPTLG